MLNRLSDAVIRITEIGLWLGFLCLTITVGLQVVARNLFKLPLIWTLDLAQLLFSWLIFVGAAVAFRKGMHYTVDVLPESWTRLRAALDLVSFAAAAIVIYVLVVHGWTLTQIRYSGTVQSLGISRAWMFAPIPLSGLLMLLFLIESALGHIRKGTR